MASAACRTVLGAVPTSEGLPASSAYMVKPEEVIGFFREANLGRVQLMVVALRPTRLGHATAGYVWARANP